jgi:hypothetical protein
MNLKKTTILLFAFTTFLAGHCSAQAIKSSGFKVAITSANQKFDYFFNYTPETKRRIGINAAYFVEWLNHPFFSILTQLEYCQRGAGLTAIIADVGPDYGKTTTLYNRIDYLSLPVFAKFAFNAEPVRPYLIAGPRVDCIIHKESDEGSFNLVDDGLNDFTMGASIGIGAESNSLLPIPVCIEARYNFDLLYSYNTDRLKVRNNSFDFWLGISI